MILVTGGAGFIGSHLVDRLLDRGEAVVCLDDFNDFYDPAIKRCNTGRHRDFAKYDIVEGDIRDASLVSRIFSRFAPGKVVHLAARAGVRQSIDEALLYEDVNVKGTMNLLEAARKSGVQQFVFASSSSVYGSNKKVPFQEDDPIRQTISPYAATKYAGELMCHSYHHLYGMPTTCLRFFTVYGPRQRPEMAIHKFTRLIYSNKAIPFFGNGETSRDYTYVDDIIQGVLAAIDKPCEFEVFNLGESFCINLAGLVDAMREISGKDVKLQRLPLPPGDVEKTFADVSKARKLLGYNPEVNIRQGLGNFFRWFEETL